MSATEEKEFVRIRIKRSDHPRITQWVTYDRKIHDVITLALDALDKRQKKG